MISGRMLFYKYFEYIFFLFANVFRYINTECIHKLQKTKLKIKTKKVTGKQ